MASRYQKVTDVEKALRYYDTCLLYREWDMGIFVPYEHIHFIYNSRDHAVERIKHAALTGRAFILVEDDNEERPIG